MAVVDFGLHWSGATGSWESGRREYTAVYRVWTDDPLDGPITIILEFQSNPLLPSLGSPFAYGNDGDAWAYCNKIDPQREDRSSLMWTVVCTFATIDKEKEQGRDKDGNPTDNPLEFHSELEISKAQYQRVAERVWNLTALPGRPVNTAGPATNSAGVLFDPPPMRDDSHLVLRITRYMDHFPEDHARQYCDGINSKKFTLHLAFQQFTSTFFRHEAKLQNIGGSFNARIVQDEDGRQQLLRYYKVAYEIHQRDGGWIEEVPDRGLQARAKLGDPDGRGGTVGFKADGSAMDNQEMAAAYPSGVPQVRVLKDAWGENLREPVLFNGQGQPKADADPVFWIKYRTLKEFPFDALNLSDPT